MPEQTSTAASNPVKSAIRSQQGEWIELVMVDFLSKISSISLARYPRIRRWADTEDIRQTAAARLIRAVRKVEPDSLEHVRSLAVRHIEFTLLSFARTLKRRSISPFVTPVATKAGTLRLEEMLSDNRTPTCEFEPWERLHQAIADLPADEGEVFQLMWYHGFQSRQVADRLDLSRERVRRRYARARGRLMPFLEDVRKQMN